MKPILILLIIAFSLTSCLQEKLVLKSNRVEKINYNVANNSYSITSGKPKKTLKTAVTEKDRKLEIDDPVEKDYTWDSPVSLQANDPRIVGNTNKVFFKDKAQLSTDADPRRSLHYLDMQVAIQTLTIPLKVRPALTQPALRDSFPSQAISGFNLGFSAGWQFRYNVFKSKKNLFGNHTTKWSFTPGGFIGLGAQKLNNDNTRGPNRFKIERSAVSVSLGFYAMLGFDRFNVGYAIGWDYATGNGRQAWVYQGHHWNGIIVALDIFK